MPIMHPWWIGIGGNGISIDNHYNCHTKDKLVTKIPACGVSELKIAFHVVHSQQERIKRKMVRPSLTPAAHGNTHTN